MDDEPEIIHAENDEDLKCSVCLGYYCEPITLMCGHNICYPCAENITKAGIFRGYGQPPSSLECPQCKLRVWFPPRSTCNCALRNLVIQKIGQEDYDRSAAERIIDSKFMHEVWSGMREIINALAQTEGYPPHDVQPRPLPLRLQDVNVPAVHVPVPPFPEPDPDTDTTYNPEICGKYNSARGCSDVHCKLRHEYSLWYLGNDMERQKSVWWLTILVPGVTSMIGYIGGLAVGRMGRK